MREALIIGAGIAGCSVAWSLAQRGVCCTILERAAELAAGASGNPLAVWQPMRVRGEDLQAAFVNAGVEWLDRLRCALPHAGIERCGVFRPNEADERNAAESSEDDQGEWIDRAEAEARCGIALEQSGVWTAVAGSLEPKRLLRAMLEHAPGVALCTGRTAARLVREAGQWTAVDEAGGMIARAPVAVIANACSAASLDVTAWLPIEPVRGQVTLLTPSASSAKLRCVIAQHGYLTPAAGSEAQHVIGATYQRDDPDDQLRAADHQANLDRLQQMLPGLAGELEAAQPGELADWPGRVAWRCVSRDRRPIVGGLPDVEAALAMMPKPTSDPPPPEALPHWPGMFATLAHGSRGFATAPLAGELLAGVICDEPLPVTDRLAAGVDPGRLAGRWLLAARRGERGER